MVTQDLHMHTLWDDGSGSAEEMICAAAQRGMTCAGVSVHAPMPFGVWACEAGRLDAFFEEMRRLRARYAGRIEVYAGAEWDPLSTTALEPFDYVIGAVHHLQIPRELPPGFPPELAERFGTDYPTVDESAAATARLLRGVFKGDADALAEAYYAEVKKLGQAARVDIVGHFDLLTKFNEAEKLIDSRSPRYRRAALDALETLVQAGKIIEINTGAMARGHRSAPYPDEALLCALSDMGGRITFGSDAHCAQDAAFAFKQAAQLARRCGFAAYWRLTERGFEPEAL